MNPDVSKLPKWAQELINQIQTDRDVALRNLQNFLDSQTVSPIQQLVMVPSKNGGMEGKTRYIQGKSVRVLWGNIELDIILHENSIQMTFGSEKRMFSGGVAMFPQSGNSIVLREVDYKR